jgi:hypothetical protein
MAMGIDEQSLAVISAAKSLGVDFTKTLMVGRQTLAGSNLLPPLTKLFAVHRIEEDPLEFLRGRFFFESLFELLGAREVASLDYSDYQQATHVHDLNDPIPDALRESFSCVYDGGTIEHVFNCPQALRNAMEMVSVGGHFVQVAISNNFCGHGFWQLSPDLIFRVLSEENGFQVKVVLACEVAALGRWFAVGDPKNTQRRVEICNSKPTYITTVAQRVNIVPIFSRTPQQSDYQAAWERSKKGGYNAAGPSASSATRLIPRAIRQPLKTCVRVLWPDYRWQRPENQPGAFRRVSEDDVFRGRNLHV